MALIFQTHGPGGGVAKGARDHESDIYIYVYSIQFMSSREHPTVCIHQIIDLEGLRALRLLATG